MNDLSSGIFLSLFLGWAGGLALLFSGRDRQEALIQVRLFLWAFAIRFAVSVAVYQFGLVSVLGDEDSGGWMGGVTLQHKWVQQEVGLLELPAVLAGAFEGHHRGYFFLLGTLFYFTDLPYRLAAAALNCFFGALTVALAYRVARALFSPWVAIRVGWWCCFFPSLIIWSAQTVKEPVVIVLETAALYGCVRLRQLGLSPRHILLCVAAIVLLLPFRFYASYIVLAAVLLTLFLPMLVQWRSAMAGFSVVAVLLTVLVGTGLYARSAARQEKLDLERAQSFRVNVASGGTRWGGNSGVRTADIRTPAGLVQGMTIGAAHLLFAPFPWQLGGGSLRMLLTLPELLIWWWLFVTGVVPGARYAIRHRLMDISAMLLLLVGLGVLYSLMFGNVGMAFRYRAQLLPWLLIFAAVGLEQQLMRRLAIEQARRAPFVRRDGRLRVEG